MKNTTRNIWMRALAATLIVPLMLMLAGCPSQNTLAVLAQTLGNSGAQIAVLEGNAALGTKLTTDTTAAVNAIKNWKNGTPAQNAIQALSIVEDDLNLFPGTSQYAPLVVLAVGTVQSILAMLPNSPVAAEMAARSPHGRVTLMQPAPKTAAEFRKQWNEVIAANPQLSAATIR